MSVSFRVSRVRVNVVDIIIIIIVVIVIVAVTLPVRVCRPTEDRAKTRSADKEIASEYNVQRPLWYLRAKSLAEVVYRLSRPDSGSYRTRLRKGGKHAEITSRDTVERTPPRKITI